MKHPSNIGNEPRSRVQELSTLPTSHGFSRLEQRTTSGWALKNIFSVLGWLSIAEYGLLQPLLYFTNTKILAECAYKIKHSALKTLPIDFLSQWWTARGSRWDSFHWAGQSQFLEPWKFIQTEISRLIMRCRLYTSWTTLERNSFIL